MRRPEFIAKHGGMPHGWLGRFVASIMERETTAINQDVIALLDPKDGEAVLDVGTGNGISLRHLAARVGQGPVVGVDHSPVMCGRAARNNAEFIAEGRVTVRCTRSDDLPFETGCFDAAMSVHTLYFWDPAEPHLAEIARVLRPGGKLVLAFRPDTDPATTDFPSAIYTFRSVGEIESLAASCGFENFSLENGANSEIVLTIAACGGGGDGGTSVRGPSGSLTFESCTVPDGEASCPGSISWTTSNADMPRLSVDGVTLSEEASGTVNLDLPGDFIDVVLADGGVTLDSVTFRGVCESASAWDGAVCTVYSIRLDERISTTFLENGEPVQLEVVIFKPLGPGPFPTVMFNHGSTGDGSDPSLFTVTTYSETVAKFFTDQGWMVAFPQRRGRGQSDGLYDEGFNASRTFYSCERNTTLAGAERALADLDAAVDWLRIHTNVDTTRMLVSGASRGGVLSLVHLARRPDVYLGAINFVGGWLGEGCGDYVDVNRTLFVEGAMFPGSSIWLYANNDSFYSVAHSQANFKASAYSMYIPVLRG